MNSILTIFMTKYLLDRMGHLSTMPPANAEAWYHTFVSTLYFLPIFGAVLADAVFGKFWVVFWISIVYCAGHAILALIGTPIAHTIEPRYLLAIGLILNRHWRRRNKTMCLDQRRRPIWRIEQAFADPGL